VRAKTGEPQQGQKKTAGVVACLAIDRYRVLRKDRGGMKECSVMLAAIKTVAKADPIWNA
jgi:uncharacterized OsmC-like protein